MPANVRNFHIALNVDGSRSPVSTGPRSRDGGFTATINQRNNGGVTQVLRLVGEAREDGELWLTIMDGNGQFIERAITRR